MGKTSIFYTLRHFNLLKVRVRRPPPQNELDKTGRKNQLTGRRVELRPEFSPELVIRPENPDPDPLLPSVAAIDRLQYRASDPRNQKDGVEVWVNVGLGLPD